MGKRRDIWVAIPEAAASVWKCRIGQKGGDLYLHQCDPDLTRQFGRAVQRMARSALSGEDVWSRLDSRNPLKRRVQVHWTDSGRMTKWGDGEAEVEVEGERRL